jgi:UDPglucose 6-dehydrogenase
MTEAGQLIDGLVTCTSADEAISGADGIVIITEWNEFRALDPAALEAAMAGNVVVDLRNLFSPAEMKAAGLAYVCVGRPEDAR